MSAAGTYGGALYGSGVTLEHLLAAVLRLARRYSLTWRLTPYEPFAALLADALYALTKNWLGLWTLREDSSETLDLKDLRRNGGLLEHVCYSCRKQIHKGERAGIAVRQAVAATEWTAFIGLYRRAISRWGEKATLSYPDELFWALQDLAPESCRLWLAYHDEKLVGGSVNFYHNRHAVEWLAAYDPDAFVLGVRNWQTMQMIEHASTTGFMVYDFNPSGSLQGTRRFKQTFATQQRQAPLVVRRTVLHRVLERIRH
ncbi:MAG: GNAT family N-acetyltransferase [Candidatus Aminicenantes bacterium]|nr:GNAT family N-acetyltransferase [Candidatus Aminicenantes bacterium]